MTIADVLTKDLKGDILIIGPPSSGKSWLAPRIGLPIIHTDSFIDYGYKIALYKLMDYMEVTPAPRVIEGVLGYRLLRKGVELGTYYPDTVIELEVSPERIEKTYKEERDAKKLAYIKQFNDTHAKILADYRAMNNPNKPVWYTVKNDY